MSKSFILILSTGLCLITILVQCRPPSNLSLSRRIEIEPISPQIKYWNSKIWIEDNKNKEIKFKLESSVSNQIIFKVAIIGKRRTDERSQERYVEDPEYSNGYYRYTLKGLKTNSDYRVIISALDSSKGILLDQKVLLYRTAAYESEITLLNYSEDSPKYSITGRRKISSSESKFDLYLLVKLTDDGGKHYKPDLVEFSKGDLKPWQKVEMRGNDPTNGEYKYIIPLSLWKGQNSNIKVRITRSEVSIVDDIYINIREEKTYLKQGVRDLAVFLVVEQYPNQPLIAQYNDADSLAKILYDDFGFDTLIIRDPSRERFDVLIDSLQSLTASDFEDRQLLIYLGGHGEYKPAINDSYFLLSGAYTKKDKYGSKLIGPGARISLGQLKKEIDAIDCQSILMIISACNSGAISADNSQGILSEDGNSRRIENIIKELGVKKRYLITSAPIGEKSYENIESKRSFFSMEIENYLKGYLYRFKNGKEDATFITASALSSGLRQEQRDKTFQVTKLFFRENYLMGDYEFLFIPNKTRADLYKK